MMIRNALLEVRPAKDGPELMFVRSSGKDHFMLPGGKQEGDETLIDSFYREMREELSVGVEDVEEVGVLEGHAPDGRPMRIHLFRGALVGSPTPTSEVEEIRWFGRRAIEADSQLFTPLAKEKVLPFLATKGIF